MFSLTSHLVETGHSGLLLSRDDTVAWPVTCRRGKWGCPAGPFPVTENTQPPGKLPVPCTSGSRAEDFKVKAVVSLSPSPFKAQSFCSTFTSIPFWFHPHFSMTHTRSLLPLLHRVPHYSGKNHLQAPTPTGLLQDDITAVTFIKLIGCQALSHFLIYILLILYMIFYVFSLSHYLIYPILQTSTLGLREV